MSGACVLGMEKVASPGKRVEVEYRNRKAWYRVHWIGAAGGAHGGEVGLRCLEPAKNIWEHSIQQWDGDPYDPSDPSQSQNIISCPSGAFSNWDGQDRRHFVRRACRIDAFVTTADTQIRVAGTITDISLSGCYIEMLAPLPVHTRIALDIERVGSIANVQGVVCSSQVGLGMGVAFTGMGPKQYEQLRKFAPPKPEDERSTQQAGVLLSQTNAAPAVTLDGPSAADTLEAIVRILSRKGYLALSEISEEIEKLRTARV